MRGAGGGAAVLAGLIRQPDVHEKPVPVYADRQLFPS